MWSQLQVLKVLIPAFKSTYKIVSPGPNPKNSLSRLKGLHAARPPLEVATLPPFPEY